MEDTLCIILVSTIIFALVGAWIWAVANLITTPLLSLNQKIIWGIVLLLLQTFGLLLYLAISPRQKDKNRLQNAEQSEFNKAHSGPDHLHPIGTSGITEAGASAPPITSGGI